MKYITMSILFTVLFTSISSHATKCGQFVYNKNGWLRKYNWIPNTASENTKKNGIASSTIKPSTEHTTASVDPGVSTGATIASTQFWSSWGDCSFMSVMKNAQFKQDYIKQNLNEIKKQIALGNGGHIESLALLNNCPMNMTSQLGSALQKNYSAISQYDSEHVTQVINAMDQIIGQDAELHASCTAI